MARNYQKEYEKEKESKVAKLVKIKKEDWNKLELKLSKENKRFSNFIQDQIKKYIES